MRLAAAFFAVFGFGVAIGPVLDSILMHVLNWRWVFFINIPVALTSLTIGVLWGIESKRSDNIPIAWAGAITGALTTYFNVLFVMSFSVAMALFHYGARHGTFIHGLHLAYIMLLAIVIIAWAGVAALINRGVV